MNYLIVGAGLAGLTAARQLQALGGQVTVFDKGRGPGGRMATRRIGGQRFDHGAQHFSATTPRFRSIVEEWRAAGVVEEWFRMEGSPRYRGVGGMNAIPKHLSAELDVRLSSRIVDVAWRGGEWRLQTDAGEEHSGAGLVVTAPVPQALELVGAWVGVMARRLKGVQFTSCFAVMAALDGASGLGGAGFVDLAEGPVKWIADNARKGITDGDGALTIHATPEFTRNHYDAPVEEVAARMLEAAKPWMGGSGVREWHLHRWRYSTAATPEAEPCLVIREPGPLVLAGDGFGFPGVEGAFLSGFAAALALAEM
jgi:renalase